MKALYKNPIAIILIIIAIAAFVYFEEQLPPIDLSHLTPGNVIAMLGYISIVMLIVEQFIEIFIDDPNEKVKIKCKDRLAEIEDYIEDVSITADPESIENDDTMNKMMKEKDELEEFLVTRGLKRQRRTTMIAFVIGLILSFSGLRLMSGIIFSESTEELSIIQATIIQSIDIILTAGIIAGGSGRMHRLIKTIKETVQPEE